MSKPTILIVDDDAITRKMHSIYLKDPAWIIIEADGGEACLREVSKRNISLIVLDLSMPKMDGYAVVTQLKLKKEAADIPIILLTAQDNSCFEMSKSYEIGVSDFIPKPADAKILKRKAAVYLNQYQKLNDLKARLDAITERYNIIFARYSNPILIIDENEIIMDCNDNLQSLLDYTKDELLGKYFSKIFHFSSLDKFRNNLRALLAHESVGFQEYIIIAKGNKEITVNVNGIVSKKIVLFEITNKV